MIELVLILETAVDRDLHMFDGTGCLEDFLKTINLNEYKYANILFCIDGELNYNMSKIFNNRYLK